MPRARTGTRPGVTPERAEAGSAYLCSSLPLVGSRRAKLALRSARPGDAKRRPVSDGVEVAHGVREYSSRRQPPTRHIVRYAHDVPASPQGAGLSHVAEEIEKEGVVPSGTFDFLAQGYSVWMRANDIECESSQDREVLWSIVFSGSFAILVEQDIEYPMQPVLDAPMTAYNLQQSLGGDVLGKQVVAHG